MEFDCRQRYLNLLKKTLTDYVHVDSDYANAMPLEWVVPKGPFKKLRNAALKAVLECFRFQAVKGDRLSAEERQRRRERGADWPPHAMTMIGLKRLDNLQWAIETVLAERVPGDLIETGVWRGGAAIFMRAVLAASGADDRRVWACDSFQGLPPPEPEKYPADSGDQHYTLQFLAASVESVKRNFEVLDMLDDRVRFVPGWFENTLKSIPAESFSLLRLDGDMYGSTIVALNELYGKVSSGGVVIVDDYALAGCRKAVDDFRAAHGIVDAIVDIDSTAVYWRKRN